jgi:transmembrane sensor
VVENIALPRLTIVGVYQVQTAVAKHDSKTSLSFNLRIRGDWHSLGLLIVGLIAIAQGRSTPHTPTPGTTYTAEVSSRTLRLDDHSTVMLNKGSAVEVRFTAEGRDLELPQGEAFFLVAPDPAKPFRVRAGDALVEVLGTAFLISRNSDHTDVLVTQGRVAVSYGPSHKAEVDAGSGLRIQHDSASRLDLTVDAVDKRLRWVNPLAAPKSRDLTEIVDTLNEFNDTRLVIADRRIAHLRMDFGISSLTDPQGFGDSLDFAFKIQARTGRDENGSKVIRLYGAKHR